MSKIFIREAEVNDIQQLKIIRNSVNENSLSDPNKITDENYKSLILQNGKGWVAELEHYIVGFAFIDLSNNNIWALFIHPEFEAKGIGKLLHNKMLDWYFKKENHKLWLSTDPNTRAQKFYESLNWDLIETLPNNELKFEMTAEKWISLKQVTQPK